MTSMNKHHLTGEPIGNPVRCHYCKEPMINQLSYLPALYRCETCKANNVRRPFHSSRPDLRSSPARQGRVSATLWATGERHPHRGLSTGFNPKAALQSHTPPVRHR